MASRRGRGAGLAATLLIHGAALYALFGHRPALPAVTVPLPVVVTFVREAAPAKAEPVAAPKPAAEPARAPARRTPPARTENKPAIPLEHDPSPLIAAATPAPAAQNAPVPAEAPPQPAAPAATAASEPSRPMTIAKAAPIAIPTAPRFDADYLRNPAPRYPPIARRMHQEGKVVVRVLVDALGSPAKVELRSTSGSELLDEAALDAVRRWRFVPARQGDHAVEAWVLVPITFTLQG